MSRFPQPPDSIAVNYSDWKWEKAWDWLPLSITWRLTCPTGEVRYLKLAIPEHFPSLQDEALRMRWAGEYLPVPQVLDSGYDGRVRWLLTKGLPGLDATDPFWKKDPERLVSALAGGLKTFHKAPVKECPFDFTLDRAIALVRKRAEKGLINRETDLHEEFSHLTVHEAVSLLERTRPSSEILTVCHGDYCLPNILLENWKPTGFIDLGELGVADRWWDIAVASWSVTWNLGPGLEDLFYREYCIEPDPARINFYRLLYDLSS